MIYRVRTEYDDGYVSEREFNEKADAVVYFSNIDTTEINESVLSSVTDEETVVIDTKKTTKRK